MNLLSADRYTKDLTFYMSLQAQYLGRRVNYGLKSKTQHTNAIVISRIWQISKSIRRKIIKCIKIMEQGS